jgi:hypothetical protein
MVTALIMHTRREEEFLIVAPTKEIAVVYSSGRDD